MLLIRKYLSTSSFSLNFFGLALCLLLEPLHVKVLNILSNKVSFALKGSFLPPSNLPVGNSR